MGDDIMLTMSTLEKSPRLGGEFQWDDVRYRGGMPERGQRVCVCVWAVLAELSLSEWVHVAMKGILSVSRVEVYINGQVYSEASLLVERGIHQGCPTSGSIWALLCGPVVRRLVGALPSPHAALTCFADDLVASLLRLGDGLRRLMPVFFEVSAAIGLELRRNQCAVVNFSTRSAHSVRRVLHLHDISGASQFLVSASTY